jgi:hypothetical protein
MYSSTYVSSATIPFSNDSLRALLLSSRTNNERAGITGMLLYKGGNFMQVLEGERGVVLETQNRIFGDVRHRGHIVLLAEAIPDRRFGKWSMGFRDLNAVQNVPGYDDFLNTPLTDARFLEDPSACQKLLQIFKTNM